MMKLIVAEKPSQLKQAISALSQDKSLNIKLEDLIGIIAPSVASYKFSYPNNDTNDIIIKEPEYINLFAQYGSYGKELVNNKYQENKLISNIVNKKQKKEKLTNLDKKSIKEYLNQFEEIIVFNDADYSGERGVNFYFEEFLETNIDTLNVVRVILYSMATNDIIKSYKEAKKIKRKKIKKFIKNYKQKDFFEYNFNLNSRNKINKLFKEKGINIKEELTFNMMQALYIIKEKKESEHIIIDYMDRYEIGSCASRAAILDKIINENLAIITNTNSKVKQEVISILKQLNKDMFDINFRKRFYKDMEILSLENFKEKYANYLIYFFH